MYDKRGFLSYRAKRIIILAISLAILGVLYTFKNISFLMLSLSAIALIVIFYLVDHLFDLRFAFRHYVFIIFIAVASFLLSPLYTIYSLYDKILHFVQPVMLCSIVFYMVSHLKLKLKWRLLFTFFIVTGSVGLFEIGEYVLDYLFDLNLQGVFVRDLQDFGATIILQDRINDTMMDMILGVLGSIVYVLGILMFFRKKVS